MQGTFLDSVFTDHRIIAEQHPSADWIGLIDANGRVGSVEATCVGRAMLERENGNGARLRCAMTAGSFFLANTFGSGRGPT